MKPEIVSGAFWVDEAWTIHIPKLLSFHHLKQTATISLRSLSLPKVPFNNKTLSIADREDYRVAAIMALDTYMIGSASGKNRHSSATYLLRQIAKIAEYGWINGIYSLEDWTPSAFERLAAQLATGGWYEALQLERRCNELLSALAPAQIRSLWSIRSDGSAFVISLSRQALSGMRTNAAHWERFRVRQYLAKKCLTAIPELEELALQKVKFGYGSRQSIMSVMGAANLFARRQAVLKFVPYPKPFESLKKLNIRGGGRTRSLGPGDLAEILAKAHWWIFTVGPVIQGILEELIAQRCAYEGSHTLLRDRLARMPKILELEQLLGQSVRTPYGRGIRGGVSLAAVTESLFVAAMILIATLNARRKDEIIHPVIGLNNSSLLIVDDELGVYTCNFYIEKTVKEYVSFYVGRATRDVIAALGRMNALARRIGGDDREKKSDDNPISKSLFIIPIITSAPFQRYKWPVLDRRRRTGVNNDAFSLKSGENLTAHMFRRAYALLFHYRFEHGGLIALSQQLGHFDIEMTRVYVTDTPSTPIQHTAMALYGGRVDSEYDHIENERRMLANDIAAVGEEKMRDFISRVIRGSKDFSGGYQRLVQRFSRALSGRITYDGFDLEEHVIRLADLLVHRGHMPTPMKHGTCMLGSSRSRLKGHCHSETLEGPERALASPVACSRCPYHIVTIQHVRELQKELDLFRRSNENDSSASTLQGRAILAKVEMLKSIIGFHVMRINGASPV